MNRRMNRLVDRLVDRPAAGGGLVKAQVMLTVPPLLKMYTYILHLMVNPQYSILPCAAARLASSSAACLRPQGRPLVNPLFALPLASPTVAGCFYRRSVSFTQAAPSIPLLLPLAGPLEGRLPTPRVSRDALAFNSRPFHRLSHPLLTSFARHFAFHLTFPPFLSSSPFTTFTSSINPPLATNLTSHHPASSLRSRTHHHLFANISPFGLQSCFAFLPPSFARSMKIVHFS